MTTKTADGLREAIDEAVVENEFPSDLSEGTYTIVDTSKVARAIVEYLELHEDEYGIDMTQADCDKALSLLLEASK